jgi:hypothetical protein
MIKLIEVLRVNKPILIEVDWSSFYITSIIINGQEFPIDKGFGYWDGGELYFGWNLRDAGSYRKLTEILYLNEIPFKKSPFNDALIIDPEYVQVLNPK